MTNLNNDSIFSETLTSKESPILLGDDELFVLTISDKNFLFTKYKIMIKPLYLQIYSNKLPAKVYIKDKEISIIDNFDKKDNNAHDNYDIDYEIDNNNDNSIKKVGPIAPGIYDVTLKTNDVFGNELS